METRIEAQRARYFDLHNQLQHLYERLGKDPAKDYCLAYKNGSENITAFIVKQVRGEDSVEQIMEVDAFRWNMK